MIGILLSVYTLVAITCRWKRTARDSTVRPRGLTTNASKVKEARHLVKMFFYIKGIRSPFFLYFVFLSEAQETIFQTLALKVRVKKGTHAADRGSVVLA